MSAVAPPSGRISGRRMAAMLGAWRHGVSRTAGVDLAAAVRLLVLDGRLPAGTVLPAERELAGALGVSRTLVGSALDRLRAESVVASRRGSGSWITLPGTTQPAQPPTEGGLLDLARAAPEAIPGIAAAVDAARLRIPEALATTGYHERGVPELRAVLAERYTGRGLPTAPEQIVVTGGAHAGLVLVLAALTSPGDRVLTEQPGYPNAFDAIRSAHCSAVPVAMTEEGWSVEDLAAALRQAGPSVAYLIPEFQNPTGHLMDAPTRERVGRMLNRNRTVAVADETLLELDYTGSSAPMPLAAFAEERVITIGSASKSHWGGLRLGWVRASRELADRLVGARSAVDLGSPVFEQLVLTELLRAAGDALAARRAEFSRRRDALVDALRERCPQWRFLVPGGGLSLWCELGSAVSTRLAVAAENHGLRLAPGARFGAYGGMERMLRVPFALPPGDLAVAASTLALASATLVPPAGLPVGVPVV